MQSFHWSESLEEEIGHKSDLIRQLTREQAEAHQWCSRFENEGLVPGNPTFPSFCISILLLIRLSVIRYRSEMRMGITQIYDLDEELDDLRRKQIAQIADLQNEVNAVAARLQSLEKQ